MQISLFHSGCKSQALMQIQVKDSSAQILTSWQYFSRHDEPQMRHVILELLYRAVMHTVHGDKYPNILNHWHVLLFQPFTHASFFSPSLTTSSSSVPNR